MTNYPRLRITFAGSVSDVLPWKFTPQQREVKVLPGETALAFFKATNKSDEDIIGIATYSVTPGQVAPYFSKIQCFCFEGEDRCFQAFLSGARRSRLQKTVLSLWSTGRATIKCWRDGRHAGLLLHRPRFYQ